MIHFKACPRCRGDMAGGQDPYGHYLECLQCGYQMEAKKTPPTAKTPHADEDKAKAGAA